MARESPDITHTVTVQEDVSRRVHVREWALEVVAGPDKGKKATSVEGLIRVGSDSSNDLVLSDNTVSRKHLEVERTMRGLYLRDLGSRNGTWLDGRQIGSAMVEPGDKIGLGKTKLAVKEASRGKEVELAGGEEFGDLVGSSQAMRLVFAELRAAATDDANLLIEGETGTGKELAARAVHEHSMRRHGPFQVVDCAMITEANAEAELFGQQGAFALAQNGTLFFDEIAALPLAVQPKLLRAIEAKEQATGSGGKSKPLNVRVAASTAHNLAEEVEQGHFKKELFFRFSVRVKIPPLRTRKSDLPLLAKHLAKGLDAEIQLTPQMLTLLEGYDWPGNVRELRNVLERGALMQQTGNSSWMELLIPPAGKSSKRSMVELVGGLPYHEAKDRVLADFERQYFAQVMKTCQFDIKVAEGHTGLSMQSLYRLLKKNGLRLKDLKNTEGLT